MVPTPVAVVLTAVFLVTGLLGCLALVRGAHGRPGPCGNTRATELLHLLMSVAMIAMAWGWTGGPDTVGGAVQLVVFGGFAAVLGTLGVVGLVGAHRGRRAARSARSSHGLMAAAMVWMVAAMPLLTHADASNVASPVVAHLVHGATGHGAAGHGAAGHGAAGHGATSTAASTAPGPTALLLPATAGWVSAASTVLVALLAVVGLAWVVRMVQLGSPAHRARFGDPLLVPAPRSAREPDPVRVPATASGAGWSGLALAPARRPVRSVQVEPVAVRVAPHLGPAVLAASCHALMGLGKAAMLAAML